MDRRANPQIAARTADRIGSRAAALVAREERGETRWHATAAEPEPEITDNRELRSMLDEAGDVLAGLPEIEADPDFDADADADAIWLRQRGEAWTLHAIARRRLLRLAAALRVADAAALPEIAPEHQRAAHLFDILARHARDTLSALAHARLRVAHICITARAMRAGRASAATSAAHAQCC